MKKFFILLFSCLFLCFSTISVISCSPNEIEKVSKNLSTYSIFAQFNDNDKTISASENFLFVNNFNNDISTLCFHLYPRAFREGALFKPYTSLTLASTYPNGLNFGDLKILNVSCDNNKLTYNIVGEDEDILKIDFENQIKKNSSQKIKIDFELKIPNSTHRFGFYDGNVNLGNWYPILCAKNGENFDTSPYYSTGDPFYSEIANYVVEFAYPNEYSFASTGNFEILQTEGKNLAKISAQAVRDFAISMSKNRQEISTSVLNTKVVYAGYKTDAKFNEYLGVAAKSLEFFNKNFGNYPYSCLTIVKSPFVFGGMEYPGLVLISDSITDEDEFIKVIVHEIAHQWWYGVVGNNQIDEAWLDESLAEFSAALFFKNNTEFKISYDEIVRNAVSSYELYVDVISTIRGSVNTKMNLKLSDYQNDYEYSYMVYVKGVIMFDSLSSAVGEKKVVAGLKKYYAENKFKIATKKEFYQAFNSACHKDVEGFFDGFLNGTSIISSVN